MFNKRKKDQEQAWGLFGMTDYLPILNFYQKGKWSSRFKYGL